MKHWVAQALFLLMALCLFLPCFAAAEEAAQTAVTIDFEDGNAAAFSQSGSCTVGVTESQAHSGKQSLRVSGRGSNNWDAVDLSAASLGIEAGAKVHLSACVYVESSEDGAMAIGKVGGDYAYYAQVNVKGKEWTEISCDFEADAGVNIRFLTASDNYLGKNYCLDDVTLTITAPEKVDYSDAPQIHYTSDFTSGTDGWYARSAGGAAIEATADGLYITGRTATWNSPGRDFDLVPGRTYNLSVQVKQDEMDSCSFILSVAHTRDGEESYENIVTAELPRFAFAPGHRARVHVSGHGSGAGSVISRWRCATGIPQRGTEREGHGARLGRLWARVSLYFSAYYPEF